MKPECRMCGVNLAEQDHPLARLVAWPPCLLPGDLPADNELCRSCQANVKDAFENPSPYITVAESEGPTMYPQWQASVGQFRLDDAGIYGALE